MKHINRPLLTAMLSSLTLTVATLAQTAPETPRPHRPGVSPLFAALDANHDGVIDAQEIANAPAALKTLDKNGDGQLTHDEVAPPRPPRPAGADAAGDGTPEGPHKGGPGAGHRGGPRPPTPPPQ